MAGSKRHRYHRCALARSPDPNVHDLVKQAGEQYVPELDLSFAGFYQPVNSARPGFVKEFVLGKSRG